MTFSVSSGGGSVTGGTPVTGSDGIATVGAWTLGATAGINTLTANVPALAGSQVMFTATGVAGAASVIAVNAGNNQSGVVASAPLIRPSTRVMDANGNAVAGVSVTFAVATGGGSITGATASSGNDGVATVGSWTLGATAGTNTLTATAIGLTGSPLTFIATGTAGPATSIAASAGNNQTATVGTALSSRPSVKVVDAGGNAAAGVSVSFAIVSGGGSITGAAARTGSDGIATVGSWTLGATAGPNTLAATAPGLVGSPVNFTATGIAAVASTIAINAGNNQSAAAGTALGVKPSVKVTAADGSAVGGVTVTFSVVAGGGSITGPTQSTGNDGIATVGSWTVGPTPGVNTLAATATGLAGSPLTFTATGTGGSGPGASGAEFPIANTTQQEAFGGVATDGTNYLAGVQTRTSTTNVGAQLISASGSLLGGLIVVPGRVGDPVQIAFDGTNYLMAWADHTYDSNNVQNGEIVGQFVSKTGVLVGSVFPISRGMPSFTAVTAIVFGNGTYFVSYVRDASGPPSAPGKTYGRIVSPTGVVGSELTLSSGFTTTAGSGNVAFNGATFFAVYTEPASIKGRFISAAGTVGSEVTVVTATGFTIENVASVAYNGTSYLVTVPRHATGAQTTDAFAQLVSGAGAPIGGLIDLSSDATKDAFPLGVIAAGTNFLVSYEDSLTSSANQRVRVRFVSGTGSALGTSITIALPVGGKSPLGGVYSYDGSRYFEFLARGVPPATSPSAFDLWTQKDLFGALLSIPLPP